MPNQTPPPIVEPNFHPNPDPNLALTLTVTTTPNFEIQKNTGQPPHTPTARPPPPGLRHGVLAALLLPLGLLQGPPPLGVRSV